MKRVRKTLCLAALLVCALTVGAAAAEPLDDIAWEDLTYRDIFITNNLAYVDGDGMVTIIDMDIFRRNFGKTAAKDCTVSL